MRDIVKGQLCQREYRSEAARHVDCKAADTPPRERGISKTFVARRPDWCPRCKAEVDPGDLVRYRDNVLEHAETPCPGWTARGVVAAG